MQYKTALFLVSKNGEIESGIFNIKKSEYLAEKKLGTWFIFLNKQGFDEKTIQNVRNNLQNFVTPYDVYDTMLSLIYNCYNLGCQEKIVNRSKKGESVFHSINGYERNCDKYSEIREEDCQCLKFSK